MAVTDSNYKFIYVDVGTNGRVSDGGVWANCTLSTLLKEGRANLPPAQCLPNSNRDLPFVFLADDAFPLSVNLMKPYPFRSQSRKQRIFSYRLSRARRTVENAFGILSSKFRIFRGSINLSPDKVEKIVLCCVVLHNMLRSNFSSDYIPTVAHEETSGILPRQEDEPLVPIQSVPRRASIEAKRIRDEFAEYFSSEGAVPWQCNLLNL